jgi:hypothetical protein
MMPRTSLRPTVPRSSISPRSSLTGSRFVTMPSEDRAPWKRIDTSLAVASVAGVVEAIVASWIVAIAMRDLLLVVHGDALGSAAMGIGVALARLGLVVAEALGALAVSVATGALLLRMDHRAAARETVPFWSRVVAVVRIVGVLIVFGAGWTLGWAALLESRAPWLLPVLAVAQLAALVVASFRPFSSTRRSSPSTPARASGKQSA